LEILIYTIDLQFNSSKIVNINDFQQNMTLKTEVV